MSFIKRYSNQIAGVYSCFDRVVINGTFPGFCYAEGMTAGTSITGTLFLFSKFII